MQERTILFGMITCPGGEHSITGKETRTHLFEMITTRPQIPPSGSRSDFMGDGRTQQIE